MTQISFVKVTFEVETPTAVTRATLPRRGQIDIDLDIDQDENIHIPPATMLGSLRAACERMRGPARTIALFGRIKEGEKDTIPAHAGLIWALHTSVSGQRDVPRTTTAINRATGAAKRATMRSWEFLGAGATVEFTLRVDDGLGDILDVIADWRPIIGRSTSNGYGVLTTGAIKYGTVDLATHEGLSVWLTCHGTELVDRVATSERTPSSVTSDQARSIRLALTVVEPWHSDLQKTAVGERKEYHLLRSPAGDLVLYASGQRGVLRSAISFILGSVGSDLRCLGDRCSHNSWECRVFGHGGVSGGVGQRSQVLMRDATFENTITESRTRNAIDRFTGGAADEHLWVSEMLTSGSVAISLENRKVSDDDWDILRAMIRLVVDDINEGFVRFGGSVTTGHGRFEAVVESGDVPEISEAREILGLVRRSA